MIAVSKRLAVRYRGCSGVVSWRDSWGGNGVCGVRDPDHSAWGSRVSSSGQSAAWSGHQLANSASNTSRCAGV
jgi:hypothetical protein